MGERKLSMGRTVIVCRRCKTMTAVENMALETMTEYSCPACGNKMTDHEFTALKAKYYALLLEIFNDHCGKVWTTFDYDVFVNPHFENRKIPEE